MIALAAALALPEWADVRVLGGPRLTSRTQVTDVVVIATVRHPVPGLDGALLIVAESVDRDDWHLDTLIRRASAADGAALMLGGHLPLATASALLAQRLGLTVLGGLDPLAAAVALHTHLALPELAAARMLSAVSSACRNPTDGVDAVITQVSAALDRQVWLVDSAGHVVVGPPPRWRSAASVDDEFPLAVARTDTLVHLPVQTDDPRGAYLVVDRADRDQPAALLAVLRLVAETVSARLARQRLSAERDARHRMSLLSELLRSGGQLAPETPMRLLDLSWKVEGWHLGIRIDVPRAADPLALRPDVLRAFAEAGVPAQVVEQGSGWAGWSTFGHVPAAAELQSRSSAIRRVQWRLRSILPSVMGVGSLQAGPEGLVRTLAEATEAARIAVSRTAGGYVVQFDRLGLSRLLIGWTQTDTFAPAAASLLLPLQDQPGELVATLSAYLNAESSVSETAAVLGVHRNTVSARVSRAVELLGVDLSDPDERMAVQLACRAVLARR
ncbi:MAG: PucR family transcriptional regulator [Janthinobacterium lividum]